MNTPSTLSIISPCKAHFVPTHVEFIPRCDLCACRVCSNTGTRRSLPNWRRWTRSSRKQSQISRSCCKYRHRMWVGVQQVCVALPCKSAISFVFRRSRGHTVFLCMYQYIFTFQILKKERKRNFEDVALTFIPPSSLNEKKEDDFSNFWTWTWKNVFSL